MIDSPYQVLGTGIPPMLGRKQLFERLCRHLTKATPDHVCVVGHTLFGKSVLLNHLASHFKETTDHFVTSMYWDLRHGTPTTDDEFRARFAKCVKNALLPVQPELAEYLDVEDETLSDLLQLVFGELEESGRRLLAVLDGFDHILAGGGISRNLWDEMRALAQKTSLRLVTGSRRRLRELCKTEESRTSDFWEIFYDTPVPVGSFEDDDWEGFLVPFKERDVSIDGSALKEISNWTGGVPVLAAALAGRLLIEAPEGSELSKPKVDAAAESIIDDRRELLGALWDDCPIELQADLAALADEDLRLTEVPDDRKRDLELRGFARAPGNKLRSSCRLMAHYARQRAVEVDNLQSLFGNAERFESNVRALLELRLAQVTAVDQQLYGYVERAIRALHPEPGDAVVWARSITDRALDMVWGTELPDKTLSEEWESVGVKFDDGGNFPASRGRQCAILRLITGTREHSSVAKAVTKRTCLLVDHLQNVGDWGQHRSQEEISLPVAASFCLSAIALCESLAHDLGETG